MAQGAKGKAGSRPMSKISARGTMLRRGAREAERFRPPRHRHAGRSRAGSLPGTITRNNGGGRARPPNFSNPTTAVEERERAKERQQANRRPHRFAVLGRIAAEGEALRKAPDSPSKPQSLA